MMFTIVTGNPVDGFRFVGIYPSRHDAAEAALARVVWEQESRQIEADWWIAEVEMS